MKTQADHLRELDVGENARLAVWTVQLRPRARGEGEGGSGGNGVNRIPGTVLRGVLHCVTGVKG